MASVSTEVWQFVVEWYDPMPQLKKKFILKYFVEKHLVEMIDIKNKKVFLKKSPCPPEITPNDLFIGSKVLILSRELDIVDYADSYTKSVLCKQLQPSVAILSSSCASYWGRFCDKISSVVQVKSIRTVFMSDMAAEDTCNILNIPARVRRDLLEGTCLIINIQGEDGVHKLETICHQLMMDLSLKDSQCVIPSNGSQVNDLTELFNGDGVSGTATLDSCTCCIVKPHAFRAGLAGKILDSIISQGYEISAAETLLFDRPCAEEFLEVYDGVVPNYSDHVVELVSGPCLALEIRAEDAVNTFRVTCGPWDVNMAKELRPGTLRAVFGKDNIRNAVHCTDLSVDGVTECEYCFRLMERKL
mmetsp:Transcript_13190/g.19873  ORF Transcript_13190/g.19873 Transcript_13190/m.19873 type:complete len:359 (+) Transcript_13190:43-1119(+)